MSTNRLSRWLKRLEAMDRDAGGIDRDRYWQEHWDREVAAAEALFACVPESRQDAVAARLTEGRVWSVPCGRVGERQRELLCPEPFVFGDCPGLADLLLGVRTETWQPVPLPEAVINCYLRFPCLRATYHCSDCGVPVPIALGSWSHPDGRGGLSPFAPLLACAGCGGDNKRVYSWSLWAGYLPTVPGDGWTFRCGDPGCPHGEAAPAGGGK